MNNMEIYEKVSHVPESAKKPITAGRLKGMTNINPMWRLKLLTEIFGVCGIGWYYEVTNQWIEQCDNERVAFVNINLYIKVDGEWSKPICGSGGSKLSTVERNGVYVSDECFKMATTDAISVACKQLGVGADVYFDNDDSKYAPRTKDDIEEAKQYAEQKAIEKKRIDSVKVVALTKRCQNEGVSIEKLCKFAKVSRFESITEAQYSHINNYWKEISENCKAE